MNRQTARNHNQLLVCSDFVVGFRVECCSMPQVAILLLLPGNTNRYRISYPVGNILDSDIGAFRYLLDIDAVAIR